MYKMSKKKRGPTKCKKKFLHPDEFTLEFDEDGIAIGDNAERFMSWVGLECRMRIPYDRSAKKVDPQLYDDVWESVKQSWKIPNDHGKKVTISKGKAIMKHFRHTLKVCYLDEHKTPFEEYDYLDKQLWGSFAKYVQNEEWKEKSRKSKISAKMNTDPARVGRKGFSGLKPNVESRWRQLVSSYPHLAVIKDDRSKKYIVSRARRNPITKLYELGPDLLSESELRGTLKDLYLKEKEMRDDGSYYHSTKDVVTEVIGKGRQHGGRTRLFSDVIGPTKGLSSEFKSKKRKIEAIDTTVAQSSGNCGSSHESDTLYNELLEIESVKKCELLRFDSQGPPVVIGKGRVFPTPERIIHGRPMADGFVKVQVDKVEKGCAQTPLLPESRIPEEVKCLGDAKGGFIQWPIKAIRILNKTSSPQCHNVFVEDRRCPQTVEPSRHSMTTHYSPRFEATPVYQQEMMSDERNLYERYSYALQDDQCFDELLADVNQSTEVIINVNQPTDVCQSTDLAQASQHANLVPDYQPTQPTVTKERTKIAKLLSKAKSRPQLYKLAEQVALISEKSYFIDFPSPSGMYEEPLEESVEFEAVIQLCVNGLTDICFMHWFTMYLYAAGREDGLNKTAYFHPRYIEGDLVSNDADFVINHIRSIVSFHSDKQWFMAPHLIGRHWILILLHHHPIHKTWTGHIFDSRRGTKDPSSYMITEIFENATNEKITWDMVDCRQQPNGWECGYCVMMAIYDFVISNREHLLVNKRTMVRQCEIDEFVERTLKAFISSATLEKKDELDEEEDD